MCKFLQRDISLMIKDEKLERARLIIKKQMERLSQLPDFPEPPPCPKCGRIIYCGVNKLCSEKECPKKK